ncbi:hypothetical protein H6P81_002206 [Aristolochia fimbriata]|uniref:Uncharacterized protein n=1 Tax=Aristolochia fimbriata TaxID=158543 RepID=A0AAV7FDQ1_ARIFI|nr:hypothetical protein H6P81_002206 [Aristolochia fimbriata]
MEKRRTTIVIGPIHVDRGQKASKNRAPLSALNDASASGSKKKKVRVEAQPASLPLSPTFLPPISEIEP